MIGQHSPTDPFRDWLARMRDVLDESIQDLTPEERGRIHAPRSRRELAVRWLLERRERERAFGSDTDLFADPAWDILLALFIHRGISPVSVTAACDAGMVPVTTGRRWLATLRERGLIRWIDHPNDRAAQLVTLSEKGVEVMHRILDAGLARLAK